MAYHGNKTRGPKRKEGKGKGRKIFRGRPKEICPLCDRVQLYLTTHLQRYHKLTRDSSEYETAIRIARKYEGVSKELAYDCKLFGEKKRKRRVTTSESDGEDYLPPGKKTERRDDPLRLLEKDLRSSDSTCDDDFCPPWEIQCTEDQEDIIPPTPPPPTHITKKKVLHAPEKEQVDPASPEQSEVADGSEEQLEDEDDEEEEQLEDEEEEEMSDDFYLDEEPSKFSSLKEYYQQAAEGKTIIETLLIMFCRHLQDINGGACNEKQAILHAQNVRKIHEALDPKGNDKDIESLVKDGGTFIWRNWAKPMLDSKKKRPGTIRSYFCSIAKFCEFIVDNTKNEVEGLPELSQDTLKRVNSILPRARAWGSSVNKLYAHEKWEKVLEERHHAIKPQNLEDMMTTKPALEAIAHLKKSVHEEVSEKEFIQIRDFLIARLQLENGQRPGPLEAATLKHFERAEQQKDGYIMHVPAHKNARAGPAPLYICNSLYRSIKDYITHVRPMFAAKDVDNVFVKCSGKGFKDGKIGRRVTEWWQKAKDVHVSSTRMRKMAASTLHRTEDRDKRAVHVLMTHSAATAEKHYMIDNLNEAAERGAMVLRKNLNLTDTIETPVTIEKPVEDATFGLTDEQRDIVDLLFSEIIQTNGPLNMNITRNMMSESMELMPLVSQQPMVKKVYDRVMYLKKKDIPEKLATLPEATSEEMMEEWKMKVLASNSVSSATSSKHKWNSKDVLAIREAFSEFKKCPKKGMIEHTFQRNKELSEIMERNGFIRCYEKVKNIYRYSK